MLRERARLTGDRRPRPDAVAATHPLSKRRTRSVATPDDLLELQRVLHLNRVVINQPSVYGTDNSATLDGIRQLGPQRARRRAPGLGLRARSPPLARATGRSRPGRAPGRALRVYAPGGQSGGEFIASSPDSSFWHDPELCEAALSGRFRMLERIRRRAFSGELDPVRRRNGQNKKRAVSTHVETARSHRGRHSEPHLTIRPTGIYWRGVASETAKILFRSLCVGRRARPPPSPPQPRRPGGNPAQITFFGGTIP